MNFLEFIEALARVAEKLSPSSPSYKIKCLSIKKRRVLPLFVKFEGLLFLLYHALKTHFAKEYDPEEKILQIDQKIVT
jgi:hypothetical protein